MRMDRESIIKYISIVLAAVALILGIVTSVNVGNVKKSISFDTSVDVALAGPGTGSGSTETAAEAETETSTEGDSGTDTGTEAEAGTEAP